MLRSNPCKGNQRTHAGAVAGASKALSSVTNLWPRRMDAPKLGGRDILETRVAHVCSRALRETMEATAQRVSIG
jgi:hypothetical protein